MKKLKIQCVTVLFVLITIFPALSQKLTETEAVHIAMQNNLLIKSSESRIDHFRQLKKTGADIGKLSAVLMRGQYNTIETDNNISLTQSIPFPGTIAANVKLGEEQVISSEKSLQITKNNVAFDVKVAYQTLQYQQALKQLLLVEDTLYSDFVNASSIRYKTGEGTLLELTNAETQLQEIKNMLRLNEADIIIAQKKLQSLLFSEMPVEVNGDLTRRTISEATQSAESNPTFQFVQQQIKVSQQEKRLETSKLLPDLSIGYFNQTLIGYQNTQGADRYFGKSTRFDGFTFGVSLPIWFGPQLSRVRAASFLEQSNRQSADYYKNSITNELEQASRELKKNEASLEYYEGSALKNADLILSQSRKAYKSGEIGYLEYLQSLRNSITIKSNYLLALYNYNLSAIKLEHITGNY